MRAAAAVEDCAGHGERHGAAALGRNSGDRPMDGRSLVRLSSLSLPFLSLLSCVFLVSLPTEILCLFYVCVCVLLPRVSRAATLSAGRCCLPFLPRTLDERWRLIAGSSRRTAFQCGMCYTPLPLFYHTEIHTEIHTRRVLSFLSFFQVLLFFSLFLSFSPLFSAFQAQVNIKHTRSTHTHTHLAHTPSTHESHTYSFSLTHPPSPPLR